MNPIVSDIINGKLDADLEQLISAAVARRKIIKATKATETLHQISVGQSVRLQGVKPAYMNGQVGKVVDKAGAKFVVQIGAGAGRFSGDNIRVPASCVELVS